MSEPQKPAKNRRLSRRTRAKGHVKLSVFRGPWEMGANIGLAIIDVSETGIHVRVKDALLPGQEVSVVLEAPSNVRPVKRSGSVAWARTGDDGTHSAGINFQKRIEYRDYLNLT